MSESSKHRKLMLLRHRLNVLKNIPAGLNGGTVTTVGNKPEWVVLFKNGNEIPVVNKEALDDYVLGRSLQDKNKKIGKERPIDRLNANLCELFPKIEKVTKDPLSDSKKLSVSMFGVLIGLAKEECRYIIDKEYAANFPVLRSLSLTKTKALDFCRRFSGCYSLYRYDNNPAVRARNYSSGILLRGAVSIRYPVPHKPFGSARKGSLNVRVKLNLPSYTNKKVKVYEYDGLVSLAGKKWWSWVLQGRFGDAAKEDLITMYTDDLVDDSTAFAMGLMLTQNQDDHNSPQSSDVVLMRHTGYTLREKQGEGEKFWSLYPDEDEHMESIPKIIDMNDQESWEAADHRALAMLLSSRKHR
ncbi:MAG: hypothetical protein K6L75_04505 [Cellvibrionaceae bacterium]